MSRYKLNKKAQVGETVSWIISTIIVIGIIILFLYISSLMAQVKTIGLSDVQSDVNKVNPLAEKTSLAFQINSQNKDEINNLINQNG